MPKLLNMFSLNVVCFSAVILADDGGFEKQPVGTVNPEGIERTRQEKAIATFLLDIEVQVEMFYYLLIILILIFLVEKRKIS